MAILKSHSQSVLPNPRLLVLETIEQFEDRFSLTVRIEQVPSCPECGRRSQSRHSSYLRRLQDLPWQGLSVEIHLRVRRFRCRNGHCPRKVFSERLEGIPPYLRHTSRLAEIVRVVGYVAGGLPGSRLLARLAIRTSDDTVLRRVKFPPSTGCSDSGNAIEVLGVDDWAWRKGHSYGTILVDLEQHRVSDLLPDRSAGSFEAWLKQQPGIRVISRDRGGIYAEGARLASPAARQVADRFHLFLNLSAAVERALEECDSPMQLVPPAPSADESAGLREPRKTRQQALQQERRRRRLERYEEVIQLHRQGCSQKKISASLHLDRRTVRRWIRAGQFPERKSPRGRPTKVQRFAEYLQRRWAEGCHNATRLFEEIRAQGYRGGRGMVARHVAGWRNSAPALPAARPQKITAKHAAILITKPLGQLTAEQQAVLDQLSAQCPDLRRLRELSAEFREVFRRGEGQALQAWTISAEHSGIGPLARFAAGLQKDFPAVVSAVETCWSNGQVEGQVNRLKTLKRQMYGRAGFALLRARVLPYIALPFSILAQPPPAECRAHG
jgi:transposase